MPALWCQMANAHWYAHLCSCAVKRTYRTCLHLLLSFVYCCCQVTYSEAQRTAPLSLWLTLNCARRLQSFCRFGELIRHVFICKKCYYAFRILYAFVNKLINSNCIFMKTNSSFFKAVVFALCQRTQPTAVYSSESSLWLCCYHTIC